MPELFHMNNRDIGSTANDALYKSIRRIGEVSLERLFSPDFIQNGLKSKTEEQSGSHFSAQRLEKAGTSLDGGELYLLSLFEGENTGYVPERENVNAISVSAERIVILLDSGYENNGNLLESLYPLRIICYEVLMSITDYPSLSVQKVIEEDECKLSMFVGNEQTLLDGKGESIADILGNGKV